jgi:hypothetical protein
MQELEILGDRFKNETPFFLKYLIVQHTISLEIQIFPLETMETIPYNRFQLKSISRGYQSFDSLYRARLQLNVT